MVVKAVGIKLDDTLPVTVSLGEDEAAKWALRPRWSLHAIRLPQELRGSGKLIIDFAIEGWAEKADEDGTGPAVAVDQLYVETVRPTARLDLRTSVGRSSLLEGFHAVEGPGCEEPWAWSKGLRSVIGLLLDPAHEALRDLVRARETANKDHRRARSRLTKLLCCAMGVASCRA